ncbi:MAG TPA: MFS transporter [Nitriliruptoraceae bacterium]|nr:MFS transporter [Nitriliruptoraceae bacterium]
MTASSPDARDTVWAHRNFRLLLSANVADMAGTAVAPIALAFAMLDLTGSLTDLGLVVGARSLGLVVLLLFGGVLADRFRRSTVLTWSNMVNGVTQAGVAILVLTGTGSVPTLVGLSLVAGGADALSFPASQGVLPQTVPRHMLQQANAVNSSGRNIVNLLGVVAGAAMVAIVGPGWGIAVDAASCLLAAALFSRMRLPPRVREEASTMLEDLREGWHAFTAHQWLWVTVLAFMVLMISFMATITVLGPAMADQTIGRAQWGWVLGVEVTGVLAVTLTLARRGRRGTRLWIGMVGIMVPAAFIIALGVAPTLPVLFATALLSGLGIGYFDVAWETNLQANVAEEHLSRVYSFDALGSIVMTPVGQAVAGPIAAAVGLSATLVGAGVLVVVVVLAALAVPSVRTLPRPRLDLATDPATAQDDTSSGDAGPGTVTP